MLQKACDEKSEEILIQALHMFKCYKDHDVESFLQNKALQFEKEGICRIYLILDEENFEKNYIKIVAYFTLSLRALSLDSGVSKRKIKSITGFRDRKVSEFVLIGQIGKYMDINEKQETVSVEISLDNILDYVLEVIYSIDKFIPCRAVLVECSEAIHEKGLYSNCKNSFTYLQKSDNYYQYYKTL